MVVASGLAARATVLRVGQETGRWLRELPAAVDEVGAMPAGLARLEIFAKNIQERATEVGIHAGLDGVPGTAASTMKRHSWEQAPTQAVDALTQAANADPYRGKNWVK